MSITWRSPFGPARLGAMTLDQYRVVNEPACGWDSYDVLVEDYRAYLRGLYEKEDALDKALAEAYQKYQAECGCAPSRKEDV